MNLDNSFQTKEYSFSTRVILAILLTLGGFLALMGGDYFFTSRGNTLNNEILFYIIPFIYIFVAHYLIKKFNIDNGSFFKDLKVRAKMPKTILLGILCMIIPLGLSMLENVVPYLDKTPINNYSTILAKLILLNLCIGLFEEGLFRRIILRVLFKDESKKSLWLGFLFSSFLFGIIHIGNFSVAPQRPLAISSQIIYAMFLGMLLSALYIKYKSFIGVVILHAFVDFIMSFPRLFGQVGNVASKNIPDITLSQAGITISILLPSAILGIIILLLYSKKFYKKNA